MPEINPNPAYNFRISFGGSPVGIFMKVTPPATRINLIEYREGGAPSASRLIPGRVVNLPCKLHWGHGLSNELYQWITDVGNGAAEYRDVALFMIGANFSTPTVRYEMRRALPAAWYMSDLDANGHDFAIESLELRYESLVRNVEASSGQES